MTVLFDKMTSDRRNNTAREVINTYRQAAGEEFELGELEREFPHFVRRLGVNGLYLADAASNFARTFKWRGAMVKMHDLQQRGIDSVSVPSAGNHLRGAIIAGRVLDMVVHGFVPRSAPATKKEGAYELQPDTTRFQLHVEGDTFDESLKYAIAHQNEFGPLVHPFDDPLIADGQGTIVDDALDEAERQKINVRHIALPLGGGGLFRGVARRVLERDPSIMVHGVEAAGSDSLSRSAKARRIVPATKPNQRYGGSAVRLTGEGTLADFLALPNMSIVQADDDDVMRIVSDYEDSIHYRELHRYVDFTSFEPTTLVALAGLEYITKEHPNEAVVVIGTGRNDSLDAIWR